MQNLPGQLHVLHDAHCFSIEFMVSVQFYHGGMSNHYLTKVYDDFRKADGICRILHATKGALTACSFLFSFIIDLSTQGLDIADINMVVE